MFKLFDENSNIWYLEIKDDNENLDNNKLSTYIFEYTNKKNKKYIYRVFNNGRFSRKKNSYTNNLDKLTNKVLDNWDYYMRLLTISKMMKSSTPLGKKDVTGFEFLDSLSYEQEKLKKINDGLKTILYYTEKDTKELEAKNEILNENSAKVYSKGGINYANRKR